jgi:FAD/FMN-containing dehydrogenase
LKKFSGKIVLLEEMFGPVSMDMMCEIKNAFDPKGIMNPGKVIRPRM